MLLMIEEPEDIRERRAAEKRSKLKPLVNGTNLVWQHKAAHQFYGVNRFRVLLNIRCRPSSLCRRCGCVWYIPPNSRSGKLYDGEEAKTFVKKAIPWDRKLQVLAIGIQNPSHRSNADEFVGIQALNQVHGRCGGRRRLG
jgi:hypothetical protein